MRRVAGAVALFWLVVTLTFVLVRAAPGDAAAMLVPSSASRADAAESSGGTLATRRASAWSRLLATLTKH